jgi:hypothetical protein
VRPDNGHFIRMGAVACIAVVLGAGGCSTVGDRRFRDAVKPVLKQSAGLDEQLTLVGNAFTGTQRLNEERARADSVVKSYRGAVSALPHPRDKELRYFAMRLAVHGEAAADLVGARWVVQLAEINVNGAASGARESAKGMLDEDRRLAAQSEVTYSDAYDLLIAAERVTLGSNVLHDRRLTTVLGWAATDSARSVAAIRWVDSLVVVKERVVRAQLSAFQ